MAESERDNVLIGSIVDGDPDAIVTLYDRYGRLAFGLAFRILDDPSAAEEVVQDAFTRVWRQAASFDRQRGSVKTWLLTIVHHRAIDLLRQRSHRQWGVLDHEVANPHLVEPDIWGKVVSTLEREEIGNAVSSLPQRQREVIELAYFEGLTHVEIAERTGAPLGTVKGRLRLGLRRLHEVLSAGNFRGAHGVDGP